MDCTVGSEPTKWKMEIPMDNTTYIDTFTDDAGGWGGYDETGEIPIETEDGAAITRSPWWIDANHAPPGGGYLHLLFVLYTTTAFTYGTSSTEGKVPNRFFRDGYPTDFREATVTAKLRGSLAANGADLTLLAQARLGNRYVNHVLTNQSFDITPDWSEQTVRLSCNPADWTCLGSRHDLTDIYGYGDIEDVLADLNFDIMFVLFPLDVQPSEHISGNPHRLRPGSEYDVETDRLPAGHIALDEVRIDFASP